MPKYYNICAGETYGISREWFLFHKEEVNLEKLCLEYKKLNLPDKNDNYFGFTLAFIEWLIKEKGFTEVEMQDSIYLEN